MDDGAELKTWYRRVLPDKRRALALALEQWLNRTEGADKELRRLAHMLTGSGASYGFPQISQHAQAVERAEPELLISRVEDLLRVMGSVLTVDDRIGVLVVDDDPDILALISAKLSLGKRPVTVARNAVEAEQRLRERSPALILLDLVLPDMDGRRLLSKWKADTATASIPIFVMSGWATDAVRQECLALGADACFSKPFVVDELTREIERRLRPSEGSPAGFERDLTTGLPNRAGFFKLFRRAELLLPGAQRVMTTAVLEVDALSVIRATQGDAAVEDILAWTAKTIERALQPLGVLARWEGDRLSALFPSVNTETALATLERALGGLSADRYPLPQGATTKITFSAGLAEAPEGVSLEEAMSRASQALAEARAQGAGRLAIYRKGTGRLQKTVMVVDDDDLLITLIKHRLEREGFHVVPFLNGPAAYAAAPAVNPDLVILDVKMPEMDGFELLERLRTITAFKKTPILMLTSMGGETDVVRGLSLGADDYILKPFSPVELLARVHRHLKSQ